MAWLHKWFRVRFQSMQSITNGDLKWLVSIILHKVHLNIDLSDKEARDFMDFMGNFIKPASLPPRVAHNGLYWSLSGLQALLETRASWMDRYRAAVLAKWPGLRSQNASQVTLLASAMLDSLALAGGLSVPSVLDHMTALLIMDSSPAAPLKLSDMAKDGASHDFMLETIRRFAPVAGVPWWTTPDGGRTWRHEIPNVMMAMVDPAVFPDPLAFTPGRPGLNHLDESLSMNWAEPAVVNGDVANPRSYGCPGRQLSIQIIKAFIQELAAAGPLTVDNPKITLNAYESSGWTLRRAR